MEDFIREALKHVEVSPRVGVYFRADGDEFEIKVILPADDGKLEKPGPGFRSVGGKDKKTAFLQQVLDSIVRDSKKKRSRAKQEPSITAAPRSTPKDALIRRLTRTSVWRGPFLQGGAPGLGRRH